MMAEGHHHEQMTHENHRISSAENNRDCQRQPGELKASRESAEDEWDAVATVVPGFGNGTSSSNVISKSCELITFNEALQFFQTTNMQDYERSINPTLSYSGFSFLLRCLCGPPKLCNDLIDERNLVFAIAACPLNNEICIHIRVLQTIYKKLTGQPFDCPRYGCHWELIGFQGNDPATDLRGAGFWGLMNLLYFIMNPETFPVAHSIYLLSLHETQHFPFMVMSINITAIALQVLREERLNRICNGRKQVIGVVNDFYVAVFLHLYQRWKNERKTISHSGFILKEVDAYAKRNPKALIKAMQQYCKSLATDHHQQQTAKCPCSVSHSCAGPKQSVSAPEFSALPEVPVTDYSRGVSPRRPLHSASGENGLVRENSQTVAKYEQNVPETAHVVMSNGTVIAAKVYDDGEELFI